MNMRLITNREIEDKQQSISTEFRRSQQSCSIDGIRHLVGSTFIALGMRIHGCLEDRRHTPVLPRRMQTARGI